MEDQERRVLLAKFVGGGGGGRVWNSILASLLGQTTGTSVEEEPETSHGGFGSGSFGPLPVRATSLALSVLAKSSVSTGRDVRTPSSRKTQRWMTPRQALLNTAAR